ncbi:MAG: DUF2029 domain-containing protein [Chloroflexi bacterium]|nr:DUF2029 domain-containing protein [Chloroflexota bacterium]
MILVAITLASATFAFVRNAPALSVNGRQVDFTVYYSAATTLNTADPDALYDYPAPEGITEQRGLSEASGYLYLPFLAVMVRPLALLPLQQAAAVWWLLNLILALVSARLLLGLANIDPRFPRTLLASGIVLLVPPVNMTIILGQVNIILLALLTGVIFLLNSRPSLRWKEVLAGLMLGAAIVLKLYPALVLIPLAIRRRWVPALWGLIGVVMALLIGIVGAGGTFNTAQYFFEVLPSLAATPEARNQSLFAMVQRMVQSYEYSFSVFSSNNNIVMQGKSLVEAPAVAPAVVVLLSLMFALALWWGLRRLASRNGPIGIDISFSLTTSLIVLPLVWDHYHTLLLIPGATLLSFARWKRLNLTCSVILAAALLLVFQRFWRVFAFAGLPSPLLSFGLMSVALVWFYTFYLIRSGR